MNEGTKKKCIQDLEFEQTPFKGPCHHLITREGIILSIVYNYDDTKKMLAS